MSTDHVKFAGELVGGAMRPGSAEILARKIIELESPFSGDSGSGGVAGFVPAPSAGDANKFLRANGTWSNVPYFGTTILADNYATGDDVADDTAGLQAAATAATGKTLLLSSGKTYRISDTVTIPPETSVNWNGAIVHYVGAKDRPAIVVGMAGVDNPVLAGRPVVFREIDIRNKFTGYDAGEFDNTSFCGIFFYNLRACTDIQFAKTVGFTRNAVFYSDTTGGSSYNTINLGRSINSYQHLVLSTHASIAGFTTEMIFLGGSFINNGNYPAIASTGILMTKGGAASNCADALVFKKPSFELGANGGAGNRIPIWLDATGQHCSFENVRCETCDGPVIYADGGASSTISTQTSAKRNRLSISTSSGTYVDIEHPIREVNRAVDNRLVDINSAGTAWTKVLSPKPIAECVKAGGAANEFSLTGEWCVCTSGAPTLVKNIAPAVPLIALKPDYAEIAKTSIGGTSMAIGVTIDVRKLRTFMVKIDQGATLGGRLLIRLFNKYGVQLTSASTGGDLVVGYSVITETAQGTALPYDGSSFGGVFRNGNPNYYAQVIRVVDTGVEATNPAFAFVGVSNNSSEVTRFRGLEILMPAPGGRSGADGARFWPLFDSSAGPISTKLPGTDGGNYGKHFRGEMVTHATAAAGSAIGWVCTRSGMIAPAWTAGATVVEEDIRANGANNVYICTTGGTTAGSGGPTGTGTGIADNTAVWSYLCPLATFGTIPNLT